MKIAVAQISCSLGDPEANLLKVRDFSRRAKDVSGAELIVFPEMTDTGYSMPVIREHASDWANGFVPGLQEIAKRIFDRDRQRRLGAGWLIDLQFPGFCRFTGQHHSEVSQDSPIRGRARRGTNVLCPR